MPITEALSKHARRTVRAFLRQAEEDDPELWEFWNLIYGPDVGVEHATAVKVEAELADCTRTLQEVFDGWRPDALADPRTEASRYALPTKATP